MKAVILAGGRGTRLAPYTTVFPKVLMPLGEKPILEIIIKQLKHYGFKEIILAVGYLSELIRAYFDDGSAFGIKIKYVKEDSPLGTVGPLASIDRLDKTFLVMNGDVLSTLPYSKLIAYHRAKKGIATIAISRRTQDVDYGVISLDKADNLRSYVEKPKLNYDVSMGIYIFEPAILEYIPMGQKLDFPDLIINLIKRKEKVAGYLSNDKWLDIGRHDDYEIAQNEFNLIKDELFAPEGR